MLVIDQVFTPQPWIAKFPFSQYELGVKGYNCLIGDRGLIGIIRRGGGRALRGMGAGRGGYTGIAQY